MIGVFTMIIMDVLFVRMVTTSIMRMMNVDKLM